MFLIKKDMKNNTKLLNIKNLMGLFFLLLGFCFNKMLLGNFISPYAIIEVNSRIPLWFVSLFFISFGLGLIFFNKNSFSQKKIDKAYKYVAVTLFSTILLFILTNIFIYSCFIVRDTIAYKNQIFLSYGQPLEPLYPSLSKREINELLYETWSRPYVYEPYTQFKERPFKGKYINVSSDGFRLVKNQGPWPPNPKNLNIFLFGGSTTFGYGVKDEESVPSNIQDLLSEKTNKQVCVYNFGRGNYFSSQERILYEKLLALGYVPDIAVFIDGLNDFYYNNDEPLFTEQFRNFVNGKSNFLLNLPLLKLTELFKDVNKTSVRFNRQEVQEKNYNDKELIKTVIDRYTRNKKAIDTISSSFNVKTFFIWQPVPTYKYDLNHHIFAGKGFGRFMYSKYGYTYMEEFIKKNDIGENFLWLADMQEELKKPLYIDIDHYSPWMSKEIAMKISDFLISKLKII